MDKFITKERKRNWRRQLEDLKQKDLTVSVYTLKFNKLVTRISGGQTKKYFDDEYLVHKYIQGLKPKIAKKVIEHDPEKLWKVIQLAKRIERGQNYGKQIESEDVETEVGKIIRK